MAYTIQQLHQMFMPMLKEFDAFCREYGLRYFIDGGTLLGAVRDGGFIPWDDDVDIVMPRPDYERLIKEWQGSLELLCHEKDHLFVFPYVKLFHSNTPIVNIYDETYGINTKVFLKIDLYPMDGVSSKNLLTSCQCFMVKIWKQLLFQRIDDHIPDNLLKRLIYKFFRILPVAFFYNRLDCAMKCHGYNVSKYVTRWRMNNSSVSVFNKKTIEPMGNIIFEKLQLLCPADYDTYLSKTYGDYRHPVRQNKGLRHSTSGSTLAVELEKVISER